MLHLSPYVSLPNPRTSSKWKKKKTKKDIYPCYRPHNTFNVSSFPLVYYFVIVSHLNLQKNIYSGALRYLFGNSKRKYYVFIIEENLETKLKRFSL